MVLLGLQIDTNCVCARVHHIDPALGRRHLEKCRYGFRDVVECLILVDPRASPVEAVPFGVDQTAHVVRPKLAVRRVSELAAVVRPLKIIDPENPKEQKEQE